MKKLFIICISLCLTIVSLINSMNVYAVDFEGQEEKYIQLCSSSKLTSTQQSTCQEFNTYLNKKTQQMQKEVSNIKEELEETQSSIDEITNQITELNQRISEAESELEYVTNSINTLNEEIETKKEQLEERLYVMQTTYNSNRFIDYILSSQSFTDFIGRLISFKELTNYENELIDDLKDSLAEVEKQQSTLEILKENLEIDKQNQASLQQQLVDKLTAQNKELAQQDSEISENQESIESITANLAALKKASEESKVTNVTQAIPNKKPSTTTESNSKTETDSSSAGTESSSNTETDSSKDTTQSNESTTSSSSSEELGLKIANLALSRLGCTYVWGAAHSWASIQNPNQTQFDCSGLVNWAHYQAGVNLGTIHYTGSLVSAGKAVSKSDLQPGDIILFSSNGAVSGVHHVGIYIGDNKMVHAPTEGMPVQVANLTTAYWQKEWYTCRRLY